LEILKQIQWLEENFDNVKDSKPVAVATLYEFYKKSMVSDNPEMPIVPFSSFSRAIPKVFGKDRGPKFAKIE